MAQYVKRTAVPMTSLMGRASRKPFFPTPFKVLRATEYAAILTASPCVIIARTPPFMSTSLSNQLRESLRLLDADVRKKESHISMTTGMAKPSKATHVNTGQWARALLTFDPTLWKSLEEHIKGTLMAITVPTDDPRIVGRYARAAQRLLSSIPDPESPSHIICALMQTSKNSTLSKKLPRIGHESVMAYTKGPDLPATRFDLVSVISEQTSNLTNAISQPFRSVTTLVSHKSEPTEQKTV
jgi:hypothetical protein